MRATYRLQLGPGLGFDEVRELVPYVRELGASHLYLSPAFQARAGSTHGYDVVDPTRLSDALGGERAFGPLAAAAREAGLGIVLDVVPNHMAVDDANRWWADPALRERFFDLDPATGGHRRFFDIDDLAGLRVEDPEVLETVTRLPLSLVADGLVDGLRVDHPDGLADPAAYLARLREGGVPHVWVEKILAPDAGAGAGRGESLRASWPVDGTTGYELLDDVAALLVDETTEERLTALYAELTGETRTFAEVAREGKLEQARGAFAAELERLARAWPDGPCERLEPEALAGALSALPVYRTYLRAGEEPHPDDLAALRAAGLEWLLDAPEAFVTRFQQTTPAVTAKGVEDTALYRYVRLLALNDVGGDPGRFGLSARAFHEANAARAERWPTSMVALQTHDAKRSADVRARLAALTWIADEWEALARSVLARSPLTDHGESWLFLQTVVAAPIGAQRLDAYVVKALRERKLTSSWTRPDEDHEAAARAWVAGLLCDGDVLAFARRLAAVAQPAALAQKLLGLTVPGVPDVYQGDEVELLALVDPDNRRPVDWDGLRAALRSPAPPPKLALTRAALALELVGLPYEPLDAPAGTLAFLRGDGVHVAVAVRPGVEPPAPPAGGAAWRTAFSAPGCALSVR
ncbi:MAG TPA: alpha-amylase family glycosyl hydrolase [Solirubrobacteraceae bacterium]|nr:alpha-amylase family glycosyl hydrolase [Solirubrobacteraceae bacterium]